MSILQPVKNLFSQRTETVELGDTLEFYREEKKDEMKQAERKAEKLMDKTDELLHEIDEALEELKGYEHEKGIQTVEDVADNFYNSRKRMLDRFEPPRDIQDHTKEFGELVEEFNDVSRKEGEVLKFIENQSGDLPQLIEKMVNHREKLENFLENDYTAVTGYHKLEDRLQEISDRQKELSELRDDLSTSEIKELKQRKKELEKKISSVEESTEWQEKIRKEEKIEQLEEEKEQIITDLSREVSRIERPVKKLLYSVENDDVDFNADQEKLRKLLDRGFYEIEGLEQVLNETERVLEEEDIADRDKRRKFLDAKVELSNLEDKKYEVDNKEEQIQELQNELDQMTVTEKRNDLREEAKELRQKIERKEDELEKDKEEADRLAGEIKDLEDKVENDLNKYLDPEIELA